MDSWKLQILLIRIKKENLGVIGQAKSDSEETKHNFFFTINLMNNKHRKNVSKTQKQKIKKSSKNVKHKKRQHQKIKSPKKIYVKKKSTTKEYEIWLTLSLKMLC